MSRFSKTILWLNALLFIAILILAIIFLPYATLLMANTLYIGGLLLILLIPLLAFVTSLRLLIQHNGFSLDFNLLDKALILLPIISIGGIVLIILGFFLTS